MSHLLCVKRGQLKIAGLFYLKTIDSIIPSATFGLVNTDDGTATSKEILSGYTAYAKGNKIIGELLPGSKVSTGVLETGSTSTDTISFTCGFSPNKFIICLHSDYVNPNIYQAYGSRLFISAFYDGSILIEFFVQSSSSYSIYFNGSQGGKVTKSSTGATVQLSKCYIGAYAPIRWFACT